MFKALLNFAIGTLVDFIVEVITIKIQALSSKNYSSFAHSKYMNGCKANVNSIKRMMRKKINGIIKGLKVWTYISSAFSSAVSL